MAHRRRSAWIAAGSLALVAATSLGVGLALGRRMRPALDVQEALLDEGAREAVVAELVEAAEGIFDAHVDGDVGRVHLPNLDGRGYRSTRVVTNAAGMRERPYAAPKPAGLVRVVLLSDSYVFGSGVEVEERFGAQLVELVRASAGAGAPAVECLHLGVSSWNVLTECAFLRRQLSLLSPDLVVQVTVPNDLDDCAGVRGHGGRGLYVPRHRGRADSLLKSDHPRTALGQPASNHLNDGLDFESRARFDEARGELLRLAAAVEAQGGRYVLLVDWGERLPLVHEHWGRHLRADQVFYLRPEAYRDAEWVQSEGDLHWSPAGHRHIAALLLGLAVERELLPSLALSPAGAGAALAAAEHGAALLVAGSLDEYLHSRLEAPPPKAEIRFSALDRATAAQVHGGIDADGRAGAYASVLMPVEGAAQLALEGRFLDRAELTGARVRIFVDELEVGAIDVAASGAFEERFPLPVEVRDRTCVSVRLEASDYAYLDLRQQQCRVLALERLALEP